MLISQRNFQRINIFPHALKAEMTRLDHSGMNGTDCHFVGTVTLHGKIIGHRRLGTFSGKTDGFQPRMPFRFDGTLFKKFPFKPVERGCIRRQGGIGGTGIQRGGCHKNSMICIGDHHGIKDTVLMKKCSGAIAVFHRRDQFCAEKFHCQAGNIGKTPQAPFIQFQKCISVHISTPPLQ